MTVHPALACLRPALLVAALAASLPAAPATQLFKCIIDKRTVYQQQACPVNAEPPADPASSPMPGAASAKPAGASASTVAMQAGVKPASRPASSAPATPR